MTAVTGLHRPDFRNISNVGKRQVSALSALFVQVLRLCRAAGREKLGHVAMDAAKQELEDENRRRKKLLAEAVMDNGSSRTRGERSGRPLREDALAGGRRAAITNA